MSALYQSTPVKLFNSVLMSLEEMPLFSLSKKERIGNKTMVIQYIKNLLNSSLCSDNGYVLIPPIRILSSFFHCSELDIREALSELAKQHYNATINDADSFIVFDACCPAS